MSRSAAGTVALGKGIGGFLAPGDAVALSGPLGAGKTTFAKGLALGLGVRGKDRVASPTFALIHEYQGREKIYHIDWYRLDSVEGVDRSLAEECFAARAVTIVEWPEKGRAFLPDDRLSVTIAHRGPNRRAIRIEALNPRHAARLGVLKT